MRGQKGWRGPRRPSSASLSLLPLLYAEEAWICASYRSAYNDMYLATVSPENPGRAQEELERLSQLAERTGGKLLARAAYHRAIDIGAQGVVDTYFSEGPQENMAWEAYQEANQSRSAEQLLARGMTERALSSEAAG